MSLRTARPMADTPPRPPSTDDDDSDDDFHFDFPQPPSISPALRRIRSSPWHFQQLEAIATSDRRHSVSPLIHHSDGWPQPCTDLAETPREFSGAHQACTEDVSGFGQPLKSQNHREPFLPRRPERLPPPAPAPSIPLPRLPRIIRKVASMRSESKQNPTDPLSPELRRPVPKIKSLKFMSCSMGLGNNPPQLHNPTERKRSWSLRRPTSFQKFKDVPHAEPSHVNVNAGTNEHLDYRHAPIDYMSPAVYSNPCLVGNPFDRRTGSVNVSSEGQFDLSRGSTSLAPPFSHRATKSNFHRYSNTRYAEGTALVHDIGPGKSGSSARHDRSLQSSHPFYRVNDGDKRKNASSNALLHGAKSFINITPERRKSRSRKSRSGSSTTNFVNESGSVGQHVGSTMKEKGEKMRKLFARASSGVVGWGRQLTGRSARSVAVSSTSGSLAPLTGMQS